MDPLYLTIALGPVAVYLLVLGAINWRGKPLVVDGKWDLLFLGLAVMGLFTAGPLELILPTVLFDQLGPATWLLALLAYLLGVSLITLLARPRLVAYNMGMEELRGAVANAAHDIDHRSTWAGDSLDMPRAGLQGRLEPMLSFRTTQLIANGPHQNHAAWQRLKKELSAMVKGAQRKANPRAVNLLFFAVVIVGLIVFSLVTRSEELPRAMNHLLRR